MVLNFYSHLAGYLSGQSTPTKCQSEVSVLPFFTNSTSVRPSQSTEFSMESSLKASLVLLILILGSLSETDQQLCFRVPDVQHGGCSTSLVGSYSTSVVVSSVRDVWYTPNVSVESLFTECVVFCEQQTYTLWCFSFVPVVSPVYWNHCKHDIRFVFRGLPCGRYTRYPSDVTETLSYKCFSWLGSWIVLWRLEGYEIYGSTEGSVYSSVMRGSWDVCSSLWCITVELFRSIQILSSMVVLVSSWLVNCLLLECLHQLVGCLYQLDTCMPYIVFVMTPLNVIFKEVWKTRSMRGRVFSKTQVLVVLFALTMCLNVVPVASSSENKGNAGWQMQPDQSFSMDDFLSQSGVPILESLDLFPGSDRCSLESLDLFPGSDRGSLEDSPKTHHGCPSAFQASVMKKTHTPPQTNNSSERPLSRPRRNENASGDNPKAKRNLIYDNQGRNLIYDNQGQSSQRNALSQQQTQVTKKVVHSLVDFPSALMSTPPKTSVQPSVIKKTHTPPKTNNSSERPLSRPRRSENQTFSHNPKAKRNLMSDNQGQSSQQNDSSQQPTQVTKKVVHSLGDFPSVPISPPPKADHGCSSASIQPSVIKKTHTPPKTNNSSERPLSRPRRSENQTFSHNPKAKRCLVPDSQGQSSQQNDSSQQPTQNPDQRNLTATSSLELDDTRRIDLATLALDTWHDTSNNNQLFSSVVQRFLHKQRQLCHVSFWIFLYPSCLLIFQLSESLSD